MIGVISVQIELVTCMKFFTKANLLLTSDDLKVVGRHNIENLLAALTLGHRFGLSLKVMTQAAIDFQRLRA